MKNKVGIQILIPRHVVLAIRRNKGCLRKKYRHFSVCSAEEHIARLERRGLAPIGSLNVYLCQFCSAYHVGHKATEQRRSA